MANEKDLRVGMTVKYFLPDRKKSVVCRITKINISDAGRYNFTLTRLGDIGRGARVYTGVRARFITPV